MKNAVTQVVKIFCALIWLTSCDCYQVVSGTVIDENTAEPIGGVSVYNKIKPKNITITDSQGRFEIASISGGIAGCPPMTIIVDHPEYIKIEKEIPAGGEQEIRIRKSR